MAFQTSRGGAIVPGEVKEILRSAAGLDDIMSLVLDSRSVVENPPTTGRYIVELGTVLAKGPSDDRVIPIYDGDNVNAGDVVAILGHTVEFWLGPGISADSNMDKPVPGLHFGCDFDTSKLVGYSGNEAAVEADLPHCKFR
jgi:hypothetical protein